MQDDPFRRAWGIDESELGLRRDPAEEASPDLGAVPRLALEDLSDDQLLWLAVEAARQLWSRAQPGAAEAPAEAAGPPPA